MNYKERLENFKASCRVYPQEKKEIEENKNSSKEPDQVRKQLFVYMEEDITYVESSFQNIHDLCGTNAELLIWLLYVERKTQTSISEEWHIDRKHIYYAMNRWMHILLDHQEVTYKDILFSFKSSCMMYEEEKKKAEEYKLLTELNQVNQKSYQLIWKDIRYTEEILHIIEEQNDSLAKNLTYEVLIKGRTQEAVADENNMTKRKLEYSMNRWVRNALQEIQNKAEETSISEEMDKSRIQKRALCS